MVFANGSLQMGSSLLFPDLLLRIVIGVVVPIVTALKERDKSADMDSSSRKQVEVVSSEAVVATRTRRILTSSFMFVSVEWVRDESLK